jgi:hypothetical protein
LAEAQVEFFKDRKKGGVVGVDVDVDDGKKRVVIDNNIHIEGIEDENGIEVEEGNSIEVQEDYIVIEEDLCDQDKDPPCQRPMIFII